MPREQQFSAYSMLYHSHEDSGLGALSAARRAEVLQEELKVQKERQRQERERQQQERENAFRQQMAARQQERSKAIFVVRTLEPVKSNPQQSRNGSRPAKAPNLLGAPQQLLQGQKQVSREFLLQSDVLEVHRGQNP